MRQTTICKNCQLLNKQKLKSCESGVEDVIQGDGNGQCYAVICFAGFW